MTMTSDRPAGEAPAPLTPRDARAALAAEWYARNPTTPEEIAAFYREAQQQGPDLDAFHADPVRQRWTECIVWVAREQGRQRVVDIGCGAGHDLDALRAALPEIELHGVEPNEVLREGLTARYLGDPSIVADVAAAPLETADLLILIDVLEHVVDPEAFLSEIAQRAPIGCWALEATATHDHGTPLHLKANWAWHPGHAFEAAGWERVSQEGRLHVWKRTKLAAGPRSTLMLMASATCSLPTMRSILDLIEISDKSDGWRIYMGGEAGIHRARNIAASRWLRETADDVCVMLDHDIVFTPDQISRLVERCRNGYPIICGAYSVRDGGHLALKPVKGSTITFGAVDAEPAEIDCIATGFVAIHRSVLEALVPTLPLCHANQPWAFWSFFSFRDVPNEDAGGWEHLSEDYYLSRAAAKLGFKSYVDPSIILGHIGSVQITIGNMALVHKAIHNPPRGD